MRVLTLTTQKGGAGKTTLAASLAVAAHQDGETVAILDTDPQRSLSAWGARRGSKVPSVQRIDPSGVSSAVNGFRSSGATLVIIDTAGSFSAGVALALQSSDLCLLPVKPSILDVEAVRPTVKQIGILEKKFAFVLNQCNAASQARTLDAATALVKIGTLAPSMIANRSDFLDAMTTGQGATEFAPKGKAAQEIQLLWQWIKAQMQDTKHA